MLVAQLVRVTCLGANQGRVVALVVAGVVVCWDVVRRKCNVASRREVNVVSDVLGRVGW